MSGLALFFAIASVPAGFLLVGILTAANESHYEKETKRQNDDNRPEIPTDRFILGINKPTPSTSAGTLRAYLVKLITAVQNYEPIQPPHVKTKMPDASNKRRRLLIDRLNTISLSTEGWRNEMPQKDNAHNRAKRAWLLNAIGNLSDPRDSWSFLNEVDALTKGFVTWAEPTHAPSLTAADVNVAMDNALQAAAAKQKRDDAMADEIAKKKALLSKARDEFQRRQDREHRAAAAQASRPIVQTVEAPLLPAEAPVQILPRMPLWRNLEPLDALRAVCGYLSMHPDNDFKALGLAMMERVGHIMGLLGQDPANIDRIAPLVDAAAPRAAEALSLHAQLSVHPNPTAPEKAVLLEARNTLLHMPDLLAAYLEALRVKDFNRLSELIQQIKVIDFGFDAPQGFKLRDKVV